MVKGADIIKKIWICGYRGSISLFFATIFFIIFSILEISAFFAIKILFEIDLLKIIDLSYSKQPIGSIALLFTISNIAIIFVGGILGFIVSKKIMKYTDRKLILFLKYINKYFPNINLE